MLLNFIKNKKAGKYILLFFFLLLLNNFQAQEKSYSIGINTGLANFESLSTPVSGLQFSLFYEFPAWFTKGFNFQAVLFYLRKTEFFLPEDSNGNYYPYFYGASFSGVMRQRIKDIFFAEEQAGLLVMKNKFFNNVDAVNYGISFGAFAGIDLRGDNIKGFLLSLGYKGAITFNGDTPTINSFLLQTQYFF